jgi:two-component system, sensor histidine kinase YesM
METKKRNYTLMKRIIKYFLVIIMCMTLLNAYSFITFRSFYTNVYTMLTRLVDIYLISVKVDTLLKNVDNYVYSGSKNYVENYTKEDYIKSYDTEYKNLTSLISFLKRNTSADVIYEYDDIQNMISTFNDESKALIKAYDNKAQQTSINESIAELTRLRGYIEDEVKNKLLEQLDATIAYYEKFLNTIGRQENLIYVLIALITAFCIAIAVRFSRQISRPIHQLALRLMKVAKGEFEVENVTIKTKDEIGVLIESFNFMSVKIKGLIEEIKATADVEKELTEQQIKNLEMENLLNQSELKFLQSQINPHFLYNTLNSVSALALIEGAEQTNRMIACISEILKYYLKKINDNVTLMEEFKIVENYLYIQKARFGDRIEYKLVYDEAVMGYCVPSMILQPFVENAIIHGLEPKEEKGTIIVSILDQGDDILLKVEDNGMGIEEDTLKELLQGVKTSQTSARGIGVSNVIRRLELKYGKNIVHIKSSRGKGTEISILVPKAI